MPHGAYRVGQIVIVGVDAVAELVVLDPVPQAFHDIQLRRVGWQRQQRDIGWHIELPGGVPAGIVQHEHHVPIRAHLPADRLQVHLHHLGVLLAHTIGLAGILGGRIWYEGATLPQFKLEIAAWLVLLLLVVLAPLFFFVAHLADAKRTGLREYGIVASRYVAEFRRKWIEGHAAEGEALVGSGDIQSLADLSNSFDVVREMRLVPFGRATVLRLAQVRQLLT